MRPRPVEGKGHLEMTMAPSRPLPLQSSFSRPGQSKSIDHESGQWGKKCQIFAGSKNHRCTRPERPSVEVLHLIRKLRWIGMEEEAERVQMQLHETTQVGGVITAGHETD